MNARKISLVLLLLAALAAALTTAFRLGLQSGSQSAAAPQPAARTILYYRNPMGLPDTSTTPKKDAMGMEYIPVYADEAVKSGEIALDRGTMQRLGVVTEAAALRPLGASVRAAGRIEIDERRIHSVAPRIGGWIEQLYVNSSGGAIAKGAPLFSLYSPELLSARAEQSLAEAGAADNLDAEAQQAMAQLAAAGRQRLMNWQQGGDSAHTRHAHASAARLTLRSPAAGIVLEKRAVAGMRFAAGEELYRIADLSSLWLLAEVPEGLSGQLRRGQKATIRVDALPGQTLSGRIDLIYPTLNSATRTATLRIALPNRDGLLRPAMFAEVEIATDATPTLTVPASALLDSGARQVVVVRRGEGLFAPRAVVAGRRAGDYVEILQGLAEGDEVVGAANFLLDSESNLRDALAAFSDPAQSSPAAGEATAAVASPQAAAPAKAAEVTQQGHGILRAHGGTTATIAHEPIEALGWPAMTMDFALANSSVGGGIAPGSAIDFGMVERAPGDWVVVSMTGRSGRAGR